jgi:hypothetical protein
MSSCAERSEAALPSAHACVVSENSVAQTTKPIASGPALSWIQRQTPE